MHITALDIGTYSIKLLECTSDKKKIYSQRLKEIVIEQVRSQFAENLSDEEVRNEVIKEILSQLKKDTKFISMVPNEYLTSRFLTLPVKSKKKAEQMIPFQLEEDLPFSLSNAHMGMYIESSGNNSQAQISIAGLEHFQSIYQGITSKYSPDVITSEMSVFANFVRSEKIAGSFCILDLGHSTTKAYFFYNQNLVAVQTSYIAGRAIEEAISDNYQVPVEEANFFKHQNAFVLAPPQWSEVDENQREFAKTMHQVLSPLISDLKRWILGFRLNSKTNPTTIYICGGTSNLRNIANYLSFELSIKTQHLNILNIVSYRDSDTDSKIQMKFTTAHLLAWAFISKNKIINFLTGDFARNDKENIPIHSVSYIGIRATFLTLVLMLTLGVERFFLSKESHELDKTVANLLKNPVLETTPKDQREFKKKPNQTLAMLKSKSKMVLQEINSIESAARIDGVSPLVQLSQLFKNNPDVSLTSFIVNDGSVTTSWQAKEVSMLINIKTTLESTGFTNLNINMNEGNRELLATFNY